MIIGITERGDAGLDLSWKNKLFDGAILITKSPSNNFIKEVINHPLSDKLIIHFTCTGFGGSIIEPNVKNYKEIKKYIIKLSKHFNIDNMVLRIDPIIPTVKGQSLLNELLTYFKDCGIIRIRYSFIDLYPHVKERFYKKNINLPWTTFKPPRKAINEVLKIISKWEGEYEFESCAENTPHKLGCISDKDIKLMNLNGKLIGSANQRKSCLCPSNKVELLQSKTRCYNKCLYCYWKD
jgi:DNA repair photolyase